ncbi:MAG: M20/M25/M40 family metallo-hydrolase [Anaerolineales bacterium]|nr:M20/M25/M40 family metallo-hydrolase [Anaerolineales bacterium]
MLLKSILDLAIEIQQIPAPTFHEERRAEFVHARFLAEGLADTEIASPGNVYACLRSPHPVRPPLVVTAHLDTVFPFETDLSVRNEGSEIHAPGIGDNALGVAALFGLIWALKEEAITLSFDLWLVATVGEEGLGDLRGMKAVVERFGANILAYLVLEGLSLGQIHHRALGVRRYRVTARTAGGHSWSDYGKPSAIHELAELIVAFNRLPLPKQARSTLNVGTIHGGISVNTIAAEASLELDLRSERAETLDLLARQVERICQQANRPGVLIEYNLIGKRPAGEIPALHPLVQIAKECLQAEGLEPRLVVGSTDANIPLSRGLPALCLGLTTGGGAHTVHEYIRTAPLEHGMRQLLHLIRRLAG